MRRKEASDEAMAAAEIDAERTRAVVVVENGVVEGGRVAGALGGVGRVVECAFAVGGGMSVSFGLNEGFGGEGRTRRLPCRLLLCVFKLYVLKLRKMLNAVQDGLTLHFVCIHDVVPKLLLLDTLCQGRVYACIHPDGMSRCRYRRSHQHHRVLHTSKGRTASASIIPLLIVHTYRGDSRWLRNC